MRAVTRVVLLAACSALSLPAAPASLWGQGQWVPPQPPCDLPAGHFKVTGGVLYLKNAAEKPNQRDQQLAQARKVLTEAIAQDHQEKNPAAWPRGRRARRTPPSSCPTSRHGSSRRTPRRAATWNKTTAESSLPSCHA